MNNVPPQVYADFLRLLSLKEALIAAILLAIDWHTERSEWEQSGKQCGDVPLNAPPLRRCILAGPA